KPSWAKPPGSACDDVGVASCDVCRNQIVAEPWTEVPLPGDSHTVCRRIRRARALTPGSEHPLASGPASAAIRAPNRAAIRRRRAAGPIALRAMRHHAARRLPLAPCRGAGRCEPAGPVLRAPATPFPEDGRERAPRFGGGGHPSRRLRHLPAVLCLLAAA